MPADFYADHPGAVTIRADGFGALSDLDLYVYRRNGDGTRGAFVTGDGQTLGAAEGVGIDKAAGAFYVVLTPYTTLGAQTYNASAVLVTRKGRTLAELEQAAPPFAGEEFRNLSIPTTAVDGQGHVYVAAASLNAAGPPLLGTLPALGRKIKNGEISIRDQQELVTSKKANNLAGKDHKAGGDGPGALSGSDIVLFKWTNGGPSHRGPVRVNQDPGNGDADQFQPWMAVTPSGQVNISYFDRRNDPSNYFIDTYLSRSEDGGRTFTDVRVSQRMWDPAVNAPTSVSGKFIGDYQGLVADDEVAIPVWNDTQLAALPPTDKEHSPYQEAFAARVPGDAQPVARSRCFPRRLKVNRNAIGRLALRATRDRVGARLGPPGRTARGVLRFCVKGGGTVRIAFSPKGRVQLAATTAKGHRRLRIGAGSSEKALRRTFGSRVRSAGSGLRRIAGGPSQQLVFGVRRGRVTFVAVADRALIADRRALRSRLRRAGLVRAAR